MGLTGAELKAARKAKRLNQTELGALAGVARCTVSYWENKQGQLPNSGGLNLMLDALGLEHLKYFHANNAPARGWGIIDTQQEWVNRQAQRELQRLKEREQDRVANMRVQCRAKTRKGRPCKLMSEAGRKRCKFHGGMSTGPKTAQGKARIAEAQRMRWQRYRDNQL
ncbi:MAG: helix-turn-helix domain-containing protein [Amylibacter sp.]|nr:helix-turn-helix domain-containing protein [Amylibacter sp.]